MLHADLLPSMHEASIMCIINGQSSYIFTKNTWIGDLGALCHITNDDKRLYDVTNINELVKGSMGIVSATRKGKFSVKVRQVNGSEKLHPLWPVKYFAEAGANCFLLTCKLSQGGKVSSNEKNNIVLETATPMQS